MDLHIATKRNSLYFMLQYCFQKFDFGDQLKIDPKIFQKLSLKIQSSYRETDPAVHYHNSIHAADVL